MGHRKPFRADPVKLGPYHLAKQRRQRRLSVGKTIVGAIMAGAAAGTSIAFAEGAIAPARLGDLPSYVAPSDTSVFYRRCDDARWAGAAPIYRGQPGYRPALDSDRDGIACEPYLGD
jgi:hypothetical protein